MPKTEPPAPLTRGRPTLSEDQISDTRQRIATFAQKLFQDEGYDAVSMRRLAKEAGCTAKTLYRYFDRKIDILRHLWEDVFTDLFDQLDQVATQHDNAVERLNAVAMGYVSYWLEKREHYFLVFMSSGVSQSDVSVFVGNEGVVERFGLISQSLAGALDKDTPSEEIDLKAQLLLCSLNGIAHNLITISGYPWATPDKLVGAAVSSLLAP